MEDEILKEIVNFYVESNDFNGILFTRLISGFESFNQKEIKSSLESLIKNEKVEINNTINPHIKQFETPSIENQLKILEDASEDYFCLYPTDKYLCNILDDNKYEDSPFSKMLYLGKPQLKPLFFEIKVLVQYFNDPRFLVRYSNDYSGFISYEFEEELSDRDEILMESFGLGYKDNGERVVTVFLRYLHNLTPDYQQRWKSYLIKDDKCKMVYEYYQNSIKGEWAENVSIYEAFIEEIHHINNMAKSIFNKVLFREDFKNNRPEDFRPIFVPTKKNYFNFIHVMDKMLSENLNKKFFEGQILLKSEKELSNGKIKVRHKGTINLLDEWLREKTSLENEDDYDNVIKPIKKIRNIRQKPAHKISKNKYDKEYFKKQNEIIKECYGAVRLLRLIFLLHPKVKDYQIPDWLEEGKIKVF